MVNQDAIGKFLRYPSCWMVAGLFLAMALVLVLPTGAGSAFLLLACAFIFLMSRRGEHTIRRRLFRYEHWFIATMTLYPLAIVSSILYHNRSFEWHHFDSPARFVLALLVYRAIRDSEATPVGLVSGSIVGGLGAGTIAIVQWTLLDVPRPGGFTNPIPFADIALLLAVIALAPVSLPRTWATLRPIGICFGLVAVALAQTKGAWLAIPVLTWVAMGWFRGRRARNMANGAKAVVVGSILFVIALHVSGLTIPAVNLLHKFNINLRLGSLLTRMETWQAAWALFIDQPWTGVGIGQYANHAEPLIQAANLPPELMSSALTHAHNDFLHLAATMGMLGIAAYLFPLALTYLSGHYLYRRQCCTMGILLKLFTIGQAVFSMTQTQLSHNISTTFFAMTAVCLMALGFNDLQRKRLQFDGHSPVQRCDSA